MMGIYKITNKLNNDFYIGRSVDVFKRFKEHEWEVLKDNGLDFYLYRSMRKYGIDSFKFEIIEEVLDVDLLPEREQYWYDKLQPNLNSIAPEDAPNKVQRITIYSKCLDTGEIKEYESYRSAAREEGITKTAIYNVINGKRNTAANKLWSETKEFIIPVDRGNNGLRRRKVRLIDDEGNHTDYESITQCVKLNGTSHSALTNAHRRNNKYKKKYKVVYLENL